MAAMYFINNSNGKTQTESLATRNTNKSTTRAINQEIIHVGIIETDFITDKIASKSYLNYHNTFVRDSFLSSAFHFTFSHSAFMHNFQNLKFQLLFPNQILQTLQNVPVPSQRYIQQFTWDYAKYPNRRPLKEFVSLISGGVSAIDEELKQLSTSFTDKGVSHEIG